MSEVTLTEVLIARENRALKQEEFLSRHSCPLVSFTMNIAGPVKNSPLIERAFYEGVKALETSIPSEKIKASDIQLLNTGCEMMMAVDENPSVLKDICTKIEEAFPLGRLFDMDVICKNGEKISRKNERNCIVCGAEGRGCSARRLHSVEKLQEVTRKIIHSHFIKADRGKFASLAAKSLIFEACTTPKPGLVDSSNNGSHTDMNLEMFIKSAEALMPYFSECVAIGQSKSTDEIFPALRLAGLKAEKAMYKATGGVNTHKGAIYSMGVICGALGSLWKAESPFPGTDEILSECSALTADSVKEDFQKIDKSTAGGRLYLERGIKGIRGEVSKGFPSVKNIGLPAYEKALSRGFSENDSAVFALLHLIANVDDTNILSRGGAEGSMFAKAKARELLSGSEFPDLKQAEALDQAFIEKNLSPGGCADLLAVTYFLYHLKTL